MKIRWSVVPVIFAVAQIVLGQGEDNQYSYSQMMALSGKLAAHEEIVREIDDPHSGARWLLTRNPSYPAGPGRLVLAGEVRMAASPASEKQTEPPRPMIHAGDRLIVEENTAVVEARLEAVALEPAIIGSPLDVRLEIGGKVVRAVALGPGRAVFLAEARP